MVFLRVGFRALLRTVLALGCWGVWLWGCRPADRADHAVDFDPDTIPDAFSSPTAALMFPGTARSFQITPAGNLYNGQMVVRIAAASDGLPCAAPKRIAYLERWLPIAAWNRSNGDVQWHFEGVVSPSLRDTGLVVSLLVAARNRGTAAAQDLAFLRADSTGHQPALRGLGCP